MISRVLAAARLYALLLGLAAALSLDIISDGDIIQLEATENSGADSAFISGQMMVHDGGLSLH